MLSDGSSEPPPPWTFYLERSGSWQRRGDGCCRARQLQSASDSFCLGTQLRRAEPPYRLAPPGQLLRSPWKQCHQRLLRSPLSPWQLPPWQRDGAGWAGRTGGRGSPDSDWLAGVERSRCCRALLDVRKRGLGAPVIVPELHWDQSEKQEYFITKAVSDSKTWALIMV